MTGSIARWSSVLTHMHFSWLLALLAGLGHTAHEVQSATFPARDNCRRNVQHSGSELVALPPMSGVNDTVKLCFKIMRRRSPCVPEMLTIEGQQVPSRCCITTFAKMKLFVDPACKLQFEKAELTVQQSSAPGLDLDKEVSPTWSQSNDFTELKYTQFGPVPNALLDNTQFCIRMLPGPCTITDFSAITNPVARARNMFQVAIYDRKEDGYECCPTFSFPLSP